MGRCKMNVCSKCSPEVKENDVTTLVWQGFAKAGSKTRLCWACKKELQAGHPASRHRTFFEAVNRKREFANKHTKMIASDGSVFNGIVADRRRLNGVSPATIRLLRKIRDAD